MRMHITFEARSALDTHLFADRIPRAVSLFIAQNNGKNLAAPRCWNKYQE